MSTNNCTASLDNVTVTESFSVSVKSVVVAPELLAAFEKLELEELELVCGELKELPTFYSS